MGTRSVYLQGGPNDGKTMAVLHGSSVVCMSINADGSFTRHRYRPVAPGSLVWQHQGAEPAGCCLKPPVPRGSGTDRP
jgi:hypothetical protein